MNMNQKEIWTRFQKDEFDIIGAVVTGISKSEIDGRKCIELKDKKGNVIAIAPKEHTKLEIHQQFKFVN